MKVNAYIATARKIKQKLVKVKCKVVFQDKKYLPIENYKVFISILRLFSSIKINDLFVIGNSTETSSNKDRQH